VEKLKTARMTSEISNLYGSHTAESIYHITKRHQSGKHPFTNTYDFYHISSLDKFICQINGGKTQEFASAGDIDEYIFTTVVNQI
jgi:hypothetical protein